MANEGFNRKYIEVEIKHTTQAAVNSILNNLIGELAPRLVRERINSSIWDCKIQDAITVAIGEEMRGKFVIKLAK